MQQGNLRPDFRTGYTLVSVSKTLALGNHAIGTWFFAIAFYLIDSIRSVQEKIVGECSLTFLVWHRSHCDAD